MTVQDFGDGIADFWVDSEVPAVISLVGRLFS
jgi:hypothetical protein